VLRPNEAAFEAALSLGDKLGLVVSFEPSRSSLEEELRAMAKERHRDVTIRAQVAAGALEALKAGDGDRHDLLVADAAVRLVGDVDAIVLGQFSLARAHDGVALRTGMPVITTPRSAVELLRARVLG
jgi:Asp/Glu/hydantoin racemase